jgi:hypothetical protein
MPSADFVLSMILDAIVVGDVDLGFDRVPYFEVEFDVGVLL